MGACSDALAVGDVCCRITGNNDALHICVLETQGDQMFVKVHTFYENESQLTFNR